MPHYLLFFQKLEPVRWLGHLDILRTFERAIRRANLPIAFTQGFNPREKLVFAAPMSTGTTGEFEPLLVEFTSEHDLADVISGLNDVLPPGIRIADCQSLDPETGKNTLKRFVGAEYHVLCDLADESFPILCQSITKMMSSAEILVTREKEGRVKTLNIRPNLYLMTVEKGSVAGRCSLKMKVSIVDSANVRPAEVVTALSVECEGLKLRRVHRMRLLEAADSTPN